MTSEVVLKLESFALVHCGQTEQDFPQNISVVFHWRTNMGLEGRAGEERMTGRSFKAGLVFSAVLKECGVMKSCRFVQRFVESGIWWMIQMLVGPQRSGRGKHDPVHPTEPPKPWPEPRSVSWISFTKPLQQPEEHRPSQLTTTFQYQFNLYFHLHINLSQTFSILCFCHFY